MTVRTSAGSIIAISASIPATFDVAGYAALTYSAIGEVTDAAEFGREFALVTHNPLASRGTVKKKGSFNEGTMDVKMGLDTADAGQIIAQAAALSDNNYSIKVTLQDGSSYGFQAQVMQFKINVGSVDNITQASMKLELTTSAGGVGVVKIS